MSEPLEKGEYSNPSMRAAHQAELLVLLEKVFLTNTAKQWLDVFRKVGVPRSAINTYSQALVDPLDGHMGWVQDITLPSGRQTTTFGSALRFDDQQNLVTSSPPALGEHTEGVLASLDLPATEKTDA